MASIRNAGAGADSWGDHEPKAEIDAGPDRLGQLDSKERREGAGLCRIGALVEYRGCDLFHGGGSLAGYLS